MLEAFHLDGALAAALSIGKVRGQGKVCYGRVGGIKTFLPSFLASLPVCAAWEGSACAHVCMCVHVCAPSLPASTCKRPGVLFLLNHAEEVQMNGAVL